MDTTPPSTTAGKVVDATAGTNAAVAFGALSGLRRRRIFHPTGAAFAATVEITPDPATPVGVPLFAEHARRRAVVRLSRGAGLPEPLPDFFGLAIRILDAHGHDEHQDLLLVTSGQAPGLRNALIPAAGYGAGFYSSILPLRMGERRLLVGAQPVRPEGPPMARLEELEKALTSAELRFDLVVAELLGPWMPLGRLEVGQRLTDAEAEDLRFNPFVTGGGIEPSGLLNIVRRRAYAGSQGGRSLAN